jgi:hypothetical protein
MHLTVLGNSRLCSQLEFALEANGISTRYSGPPLSEERSGGEQALEWFKLYLVEEGVDAATGGRVEVGFRILVERVVADFKERYPNLRISVDDG